jgi:hypothetical protein
MTHRIAHFGEAFYAQYQHAGAWRTYRRLYLEAPKAITRARRFASIALALDFLRSETGLPLIAVPVASIDAAEWRDATKIEPATPPQGAPKMEMAMPSPGKMPCDHSISLICVSVPLPEDASELTPFKRYRGSFMLGVDFSHGRQPGFFVEVEPGRYRWEPIWKFRPANEKRMNYWNRSAA